MQPDPNNPDYWIKKIPKSGGKFRTINIPKPNLKAEQKRILKILKSLSISPSKHVHAYIKKRSIRTNAEALMMRDNIEGKKRSPDYLMKIDIKNFFPSVTLNLVKKAMVNEGLPMWLIQLVAQNCFIVIEKTRKSATIGRTTIDIPYTEYVLPQGAPTSPFLSALVMKRVAGRLYGLVKKWNRTNHCPATFAVYCDNITLACDSRKIISMIHPIRRILDDYGFKIHPKKVELHRKPASFVVCGVQMNDKIGPRRSYWRNLRAQIFNALCDLRAGLTPAGFYLDQYDRRMVRSLSGIGGKRGLVVKADLNQNSLAWLRTNCITLAVPFETWKGQIEFIRSLDPTKGKALETLYKELENETWTQRKSSPTRIPVP